MIIKQMKGIQWHHNFEGGAYYRDCNDKCWYSFRNSLDKNSHIIIVNAKTNKIINYYNGEDPTMIGLFADKEMILDVYQLDDFPVDSWDEFTQREFEFVDEQVVMTKDVQVPKERTKDDIMKDLMKLKAELESLQ
ncbi:hypothetical protein V4145_003758 [Klebsiella pneumoniae]|uniref:Uncharacterized protein n=2 Tax=Caudoviricetes TaxID=2731619 RepID=A0A7T3N7A3_9CAUD|nr:hypothetical protein EVAN_1 [Klebsiella phage vB_KpnM_BovinicusUrsus]UGO47334.1 hypothetical protein LILPANDA_86 [Klebsiella phage vB_KaeM_LilPanda]UGO53402.1 hypothetical protein NISPERO_242 [Klebsiella phage vB_KaeM_Nispero]UMM77027.1 tail fiber assembly protein [Klebsiella phage UTI-K4]USL87073.1 hypothetical protein [Salmonella phage PSE-D1]